MQINELPNARTANQVISKKIIVALLALVVIYSFKTLGINEPTDHISTTDTPISLLAIYGEHIYVRDSCGSCHILADDEKSSSISLDGLGGKYSNIWHYNHLEDPQMIRYGSRMPAFAYLTTKPIDQLTFNQLVIARFGDASQERLDFSWKKMSMEADSIQSSLKFFAVSSQSNVEMIALIAYLQKIPSSPIRARKDSMAIVQRNKDREAWKEMILDSNSLLIKTALNKDSNTIARGKFIYSNNCTPCHGNGGCGVIGPNLTDDYWLHGGNAIDIAQTIIYGVPEKGMKPWAYDLSPVAIGELVAYISSLKGTKPENAKEKQGKKQ